MFHVLISRGQQQISREMKRRIDFEARRVSAAQVFLHCGDRRRCRTGRDVGDRIDDLVVENDAAHFKAVIEAVHRYASFTAAQMFGDQVGIRFDDLFPTRDVRYSSFKVGARNAR